MRPLIVFVLCLFFPLSSGCLKRALIIESEPSGARLRVNGVDCGTTPKKVPFTFYGTFRIELEKQGYRRLEVAEKVPAPVHERMPLDLISEVVPKKITNIRRFKYTLVKKEQPDPEEVLARAEKAFADNIPPAPKPPPSPFPEYRRRRDRRRK